MTYFTVEQLFRLERMQIRKSMREFNKYAFADKRIEPAIVPVGDGIFFAVKKNN